MSWHPVSYSTSKNCDAEDYTNFITRHTTPMTSQKILSEANRDSLINELKAISTNDTWNIISYVQDLQAFREVKLEITVTVDTRFYQCSTVVTEKSCARFAQLLLFYISNT